ncbi:MAG: hypothetical protein H0W74_12785 [Sphingosinicella sp.]|nr:hypothetical protein [Sphingosinicella sp.]
MIQQKITSVPKSLLPSDLINAGLQSVRDKDALWSRAASSLARRDYPEFDRLIATFRMQEP